MSISIDNVKETEDQIMKQLEASWPKTFETILAKAKDDKFYVFSFIKKNFHVSPPEITLYHQVRKTKPDPVLGTILREIDKKQGTAKTIWALPHHESTKLFAKGKMFQNQKVYNDIRSYAEGKFDNKDRFDKVD